MFSVVSVNLFTWGWVPMSWYTETGPPPSNRKDQVGRRPHCPSPTLWIKYCQFRVVCETPNDFAFDTHLHFSGTEKQHVVFDYAERIAHGISECEVNKSWFLKTATNMPQLIFALHRNFWQNCSNDSSAFGAKSPLKGVFERQPGKSLPPILFLCIYHLTITISQENTRFRMIIPLHRSQSRLQLNIQIYVPLKFDWYHH